LTFAITYSSPGRGSRRIRVAANDMHSYELRQQGMKTVIDVSFTGRVLLTGMREL
jgi:hypothetical protein